MREAYFTDDNIEEKAKSMLFDVKKQTRIKDIAVNFDKAALIILDMQEFFLNKKSHAFVPSSTAIVPQIQKLVEKFKNEKRLIIFTKHLNTFEDAGLMGIWWNDILTKYNEYNEITKALNPENSIIINKTQYDAFYNTDLENVLRQNNIEHVIITGVMTHLCCETSTRSAFCKGFLPFFVIDANATYNESFHRASLLNLSCGFAVPVLSKELIYLH